MNRLFTGIATIALVGAVVAGATAAFYNDTETSTGNVFTAGSIDLKVDHTYAEYNGEVCPDECTIEPSNLITNGGFEEPELASGQWYVYTGTQVPGWEVVSGAGVEIQNNAAGAPQEGEQHVELDSHGSGSQSAIEQVINTVPGEQYRLTFYHSPRPNNGPSDGSDNEIEFSVEVVSASGSLVNQTVGMTYSGSGTDWDVYSYSFVALDEETTIRFSDAGSQPDTLGGYIDAVSVYELDCPDVQYPHGGTCTVWEERDIDDEVFWDFTDIKPGDYGTSIISLHVYSNDAYACLFPHSIEDDENTRIDPEIEANDTTDSVGELSGNIEVFVWHDENANNAYESGEEIYVDAGTPFNQVQQTMIAMELSANSPADLIGLAWCAGDQTGPSNATPTTALSCDGNGMGNDVQTDEMIADFVAYAIQQRNNEGFSCATVQLPN